jgi:hypothetical protein
MHFRKELHIDMDKLQMCDNFIKKLQVHCYNLYAFHNL